METLANSDVFFVISSVALILLTIVVTAVAVMAIFAILRFRRMLREVRYKYKFISRFLQKIISYK